MKRFQLNWVCALFAVVLAVSPVFAGGFSIYEQGGRAMGLAGAFAARADDASAMFYNPAGIAFLDGTHFYGGVTLILPTAKFAGITPYPGFGVQEETKDRVFTPPTFFITHRLGQKLGIGFGVYVPYGLGVEWDKRDEFTGRYISQNAELQSFYFAPEVAYQLTDKLAIAGGAQFVYSTVKLERALSQPFNGAVLDVATLELTGDNGGSFAFDFSAMYKATDKLQFGGVYRSKVTNDYTGDADFTQVSTGDATLDAIIAAGLPANSSGENLIGVATKIKFPWQAAAGVMFRATDKLILEFDLTRFGWSQFDELPFDFAAEEADGDVNTPENSIVVEDYDDVNQYRFGAEYLASPKLSLRAGYLYDTTPQPTKSLSVLLPDANRHDITVGFGYDTGKFTIDGAYMIILAKERSTEGLNLDNYNGTFNFGAQLYGLSLGYRL